jgi:hypothetical protein
MAAEPTTRSFHKRLYKLTALQEAIEAYADFATLALDRAGDAWTVTFSEVDPDFAPEVFASEFANYVLAGTIQQAR